MKGMTMGILIAIGVVILIFAILGVSGQMQKEANAESIDRAADIFRRIGYADKKAVTEEWEHLKKFEKKWIICEAWEKVFNEFSAQGNTEAVNFLVYCVGDEIMKYLEGIRDFYQKADEKAHQ